MIAFDDFGHRLKAIGKDRAWLAAVSGRSIESIRAALAPNAPKEKRSPLIQKALSDAIEGEEIRAQQRIDAGGPPGYSSIFLTDGEVDAADQASRIVGATSLATFCRDAIQARAREILVAHAKSTPGRTTESGNTALKGVKSEVPGSTADQRQTMKVKAKDKAFEEPKLAPAAAAAFTLFEIEILGGVAAGSPISSDPPNSVIRTSKLHPPDHYALLVFGKSMEPKIKDRSYIVVRPFKQRGFPKKGTIVVYSDANGSTLKEFAYRKARPGEDANAMGDVPVLRSLNKKFREVQTMASGRIDAVFVEAI